MPADHVLLREDVKLPVGLFGAELIITQSIRLIAHGIDDGLGFVIDLAFGAFFFECLSVLVAPAQRDVLVQGSYLIRY